MVDVCLNYRLVVPGTVNLLGIYMYIVVVFWGYPEDYPESVSAYDLVKGIVQLI